MRLAVSNFHSVARAELVLPEGISLLAGKNGCGKTQFFLALAATQNLHVLQEAGYEVNVGALAHKASNPAKRVLWRPSVRRLAEASRGTTYASIGPLGYGIGPDIHTGYIYGLDRRFTELHNRLANLCFAGTNRNASPPHTERWQTLVAAFERVFERSLGVVADQNGVRIGLQLPDGTVTRFVSMSTGEFEFLSLIADVIAEPDVDLFLVDEIDVHFHADLQLRILDEIRPLIGNRRMLMSSHSPILMLASDPERVFYMRRGTEVGGGENQIVQLANDLHVLESVSKMSPGFFSDLRVGTLFARATGHELLEYAKECFGASHSTSLPADHGSDADSQVTSLRALLLALGRNEQIDVLDVGAGKGRMLHAFARLDDATLGKMRYTAADHDERALEALHEWSRTSGLNARMSELRTSRDGFDRPFDLAVLANVVHEVFADQLAALLSSVLGCAKPGAFVLVYEALEVRPGEDRFVMFGEAGLRAVFARLVDDGSVSVSCATPQSKRGTPLMEMLIHVNRACSVTETDVLSGLESVVEGSARKLNELLDGKRSPTGGQAYAFHCHNLAHARAFIERMRATTKPT